MPEQLTPLTPEELTAIRDYYTAQIIPECPVRGDELIIGRVLQMLDEHTRLGATVRALEEKVKELEGDQSGDEELYLPPPTRSKLIKIKIVGKSLRPPMVIEEEG